MKRCSPNSKRRSRGKAIVEGSLCLMLFALNFLGVLDVGQIITMHQGLAERARAGARWGVVNTYSTAQIQNVVVYNTPTPGANPKPFFNLSPSVVNVTLANEGTPEARVVVKIQGYRFNFFSPMVAGRYTAKPIVVSMPVEQPY